LAALPKTITATNQDIDTAKLIVTIGVDLHEESPIVFLRVRKAARKGVAVREIAARRSAGRVQGSRWTQCRPGAEAALLAGVARAFLRAAAGLGVLFLAGVDPAADFDEPELAARAIDDAAFVVSLDLFLTESTRRADVVLPAAAVYERNGTLQNWEGRPQP